MKKKLQSFKLAKFRADPYVETCENWSVLVLFLFGLVYLVG
jgi:hypothetical protein